MSNATIMMIATAPAKVQKFLTRAHDRGLTVGRDEVSYSITSPNPIDDWALWLYFTDGANGGTLTIRRYIPGHGAQKDKNHKVTRQMAIVTIDGMADALDRHNAHQANVVAQRMGLIEDSEGWNADQNAAPASPRVPTVAFAPAPADQPMPAEAEAELVLSGLRANGRFAIRVARHGHIQPNTSAKVRQALVTRGLVHAAGGALTDLGRVAHRRLVGA